LNVAQEGLHFFRRGWEAGEVIGDAAEEGAGVGGRGEGETGGGEFGEDEGVDQIYDFRFTIDDF
jgi:hypothetical protein